MRRAGFTLLEILVAVALLTIIILIMSGIFQQSTIAWDSGMRRTEFNMEGRAAVNLMAMELSQAVLAPPLPPSADFDLHATIGNPGVINFYTVGTPSVDPPPGHRSLRVVKYFCLGDGSLQRDVIYLSNVDGPYPEAGERFKNNVLVENVQNLRFQYPEPRGYSNDLPAWVDITLTLGKDDKYSVIRVSSDGADGVGGTADDIKSWNDKI